jgi:putative ABC transport system permease protein
VSSILQDLRYAVRSLGRSPAFTTITALTLALGIGACTVMFSVVNGVLLEPLPYPSADRLVTIATGSNLMHAEFGLSYPDLQDIQKLQPAFAGVAAYRTRQVNATVGGEPQALAIASVSDNLFRVLGARPVLGRTFEPREFRDPVAVLSHALWASRFGSDPSALGQSISLDAAAYTVIGVMPAGFAFPTGADVWVPLGRSALADPQVATNRGFYILHTVARLADGATLGQARSQLATLAQRINAAVTDQQQRPVQLTLGAAASTRSGGQVEPRLGPNQIQFLAHRLEANGVEQVRPALLELLAAVALVLLIACANAAHLFIARAAARADEMAVRRALGAGRWRLARQILAESTLVALGAGAVGALLSMWGVSALVAQRPASLPRASQIGIDGWVLAFALLLSLVTGLVFGLAPAAWATTGRMASTLRTNATTAAGGARRQRIQRGLIVGEIALALVLLVSAGLLIRSFAKLMVVDPGYDTHHVAAAHVRLTPARYATPAAQADFFRSLTQDLRARPGVESVSLSATLPLSGNTQILTLNPRSVRAEDPEQVLLTRQSVIGPDYLKTLGIPLRRGRTFTDADGTGGARVAMVNQRLAQRLWPDEDPVGKAIPADAPGNPLAGATIVGVTGDVRYESLAEAAMPEIYVAYFQQPAPDMWVVLRANRPAGTLATAVRDVVRQLDPQEPVADFVTLDQLVETSTGGRRFGVSIVAMFATLAVGLALVGIYGVTSYAVAQRTRELGVRMALGALATDVVAMLVRESLVLVLLGLALGVLGAAAAARVLAGLLFGTSPLDVLTFGGAAGLFMGAALLATYVPARRAARIDPMEALRHE